MELCERLIHMLKNNRSINEWDANHWLSQEVSDLLSQTEHMRNLRKKFSHLELELPPRCLKMQKFGKHQKKHLDARQESACKIDITFACSCLQRTGFMSTISLLWETLITAEHTLWNSHEKARRLIWKLFLLKSQSYTTCRTRMSLHWTHTTSATHAKALLTIAYGHLHSSARSLASYSSKTLNRWENAAPRYSRNKASNGVN